MKNSTSLKEKEVIYVPFCVAMELPRDVNLISIAADESERPPLDEFPVHLKVRTDTGFVEPNILKGFVEKCCNGPIIVHCYYGEVRSKKLATQIAETFGYSLKRSFTYIPLLGIDDPEYNQCIFMVRK